MRITDSERRQYIKEIKALLVCDKDQQEKFLEDFNSDIDDYLSDNPEAGLDELQKDFGTPQEIADEFLAHSSAKEIKKLTSLKSAIIIVCALAVIIFTGCTVAWLIDKSNANEHAEITIIDHGTIYESGAEDVTTND